MSPKYSMGVEPTTLTPGDWYDGPEPDDHLHNPDPKGSSYGRGHIFTFRGIMNLGFLLALVLGMAMLLYAFF